IQRTIRLPTTSTMNATTSTHQVEECFIEPLASGDGFVMTLSDPERNAISLSFPDWMLHQLMRILPRLDAALAWIEGPQGLVAYPLAEWSLSGQSPRQGVSLYFRNQRDVESQLELTLDQAIDLYRALGSAIAAGDISAHNKKCS